VESRFDAAPETKTNFMNLKHVEHRLRVKEHELLFTLASLEGEARILGESEVRDSTDDATASQSASESLEEASVLTRTLEEVRGALRRFAEGEYGKCLACGRPVEPGRLKAIPWTSYCLEDQQKQDQRKLPGLERLGGLTQSQSA
jgi:DnaK suppressor protein